MFSPKELEGEVDHSFFDSDSEANEASQRHNERKGKETHISMDRLGAEFQSERDGIAGLKNGSAQEGRREHHGEKDSERDEKSSDVSFSGSLPLPSAKSSETRNNSQSDEGSSVQSYSSDEERDLDDEDNTGFKLRKTSNGSVNSGDDDGYHRSADDESEEDEMPPGSRTAKHRLSRGMPKKSAGKFRNLSRSNSSSSDTESSHSSSDERSSLHSQNSPVKPHRIGSANQRERSKALDTAESEDTVTDVTPLSTPNLSPVQSIDMVLHSKPLAADVQQQQHNVAGEMVANEVVSDDRDSISSEVFLKVEKHLDRALVLSSPGSVSSNRSRKNYSFTNEEVRAIDRENQRLLRELSRSSAPSRNAGSACSTTSSRRSNAPPIRLYHSALNRQREQERIQKENLAFLKRLESVKATSGMTRDEQLADYQRQCRYLGTHITSVPPLKPGSSRTSGRSSRPCSSPHRARPETAKLNRASPRPAWS
ncbi:cilia- and flagella-associated protein 97-like isoform X2 [Myxocyprinus asiaticus]|uniref:cilia- and flagella-associated protein 97-like isoform X2 n=1 Tax=Myxocyprinus asiaticus TaxID=70543 RepID=UPI0022218D6E|nr:cilia- and flagella-associated protein 97-like isoform X2 [Myxocyprinus asiaticus]